MSYIEKNRGYLTSSKLACFVENPALFKAKYIDEKVPEESSKALKLGTAFDDFMTYDKEFFDNKYSFEKKMLKQDYIDLLEKRNEELEDDKKIKFKKTIKVDELIELCKENGLLEEDDNKIKLTTGEMEAIKNMSIECLNQDIFDGYGEYEGQKVFESEYRGQKIKGTMDRYGDMIRDYKTSGIFEKLIRELRYDPSHKYKTQQAFYWWLVKQNTGESKDACLDIIESGFPYRYISVIFKKEDLEKYFNEVVVPLLEEYVDWIDDMFPLYDDRLQIISSKNYRYLDGYMQKDFYNIKL